MKIKVSPKKVGLIAGGAILFTLCITLAISAISHVSLLDAFRKTLVGEIVALFILAYISMEKEQKKYLRSWIYLRLRF